MRWELFLGCFNGPRVYRKYRELGAATETSNGTYKSNFLEDQCGFVVGAIETCWTIALYTSPILIINAATRRTILGMSPEFALKLALGVAFVYGGAYLGRGLGRAMNKDYLQFLQTLFTATSQRNEKNVALINNTMRNLRKYDFDFRYWPIDYQWRETDKDGEKIHARRHLPKVQRPADEGFLKRIFLDGLSYAVAPTVAIRLAYPGTLAMIQTAVAPALDQGRTKLVEEMSGRRFKLRTKTGSEIDTMYVDRRNDQKYANGNVLVITSEGNGGFYEIGSAATPLEANYSVLMWNHPGFGGSTGKPWPSEEAAAIDVVIQFAMNQLGWDEADIVMYGWSIGGFTSTWAAMNYRNIRALILDATFDDIVPLALHTMPRSWGPLVERTVRTYLNLHIEKQLEEYDGPVILVRRLKDEVMAAVEGVHDVSAMRKVNRANNLLKGLLFDRYPNIFRDDKSKKMIDDWLAASEGERLSLIARYDVDPAHCKEILAEYVEANGEAEEPTFPLMIGADMDAEMRRELALYLASTYMVDFDSTHCVPLPADKFSVPRHPWE